MDCWIYEVHVNVFRFTWLFCQFRIFKNFKITVLVWPISTATECCNRPCFCPSATFRGVKKTKKHFAFATRRSLECGSNLLTEHDKELIFKPIFGFKLDQVMKILSLYAMSPTLLFLSLSLTSSSCIFKLGMIQAQNRAIVAKMCWLEISSLVLKVGFGVYSQVAQCSQQYPGNRSWMFIKNGNDRNEIPFYTVNFREPGPYTSQNKPNPLICQHEKILFFPVCMFLHALSSYSRKTLSSAGLIRSFTDILCQQQHYSGYYNRF